jgi:hypothetical protein
MCYATHAQQDMLLSTTTVILSVEMDFLFQGNLVMTTIPLMEMAAVQPV